MQAIEYYVFIDAGWYKCWLYDTQTGNWYYNAYDDTDNPSTYIRALVGSTEIDTRGAITNSFSVITDPITTDWVYYAGAYHRPWTAFSYGGQDPDQPYVYVDGWLDEVGRLITVHRA